MWNIESYTGYVPKTTFWDDFSIADWFGASAVEDTFERAFQEWKSNYIYLTELVLVLNHKMWQWYQGGNETLAALYDSLWREASDYAYDHLTGDELSYFFATTD